MQQRTNIPKPYFPDKKSRSPMVPWFSPIILLKTVKDLVLSKIVGSQLDTRELQSVNEDAQDATQKQFNCKIAKFYTVQDNQEDFYFDFIADTGDGWDSTYTIASLLSRDYLLVNDDNKIKKLPRGDFLLMGGDEVYPGPSEAAYEARLIKPYQHAWDWLWLNDTDNAAGTRNTGSFLKLKNQPDVYAIPGNHDWYDSLIAFRKVFCSIFKTKHIGQWQAKQSRSYFALGLPHNWVILAFDFGLDQYKLDGLQYHYFQNIVNNLDIENELEFNLLFITKEIVDFYQAKGLTDKTINIYRSPTNDYIYGISAKESQTKNGFSLYIESVVTGSEAEMFGLKDGDEIVALNGMKMTANGIALISKFISELKYNDSYSMLINRLDKSIEIEHKYLPKTLIGFNLSIDQYVRKKLNDQLTTNSNIRKYEIFEDSVLYKQRFLSNEAKHLFENNIRIGTTRFVRKTSSQDVLSNQQPSTQQKAMSMQKHK